MDQTILCSTLTFLSGAIITFFVFNKKLNVEKNKNNELNIEIAGLKSEISAFKMVKENEEEIIEKVRKEFSLAANEVLIEKQKSLQDQNKTSLESFINPLKEKIKEFQEKVEQYNETGKINTVTVKEKIEDLIKQNQLTIKGCEKLSNAISQNSKFRGSMGELILEKILKSSGLIDKKDNPEKGNFETQIGFKSKDDAKGSKIVDAIVYLAEGSKSVIIDSKTPLAEFMNFMEQENEEDKSQSLNAFMNDVWDRVKELGNKYLNLEGVVTPDFTIMFIPFEYPLTYIYSNSKLVEEAAKQNVIIAGPSTLIATLRTINYSWAKKNQYESIQEISKLGIGIYEKCIVLIQKFESVRTSFETVRKNFDGLFTTLKGRGGLFGQVEKLKEYGITSPKQIESKYLEDGAELLETTN